MLFPPGFAIAERRAVKRSHFFTRKAATRKVLIFVPVQDVAVRQNLLVAANELLYLIGDATWRLPVVVVPVNDKLSARVLDADVSLSTDQHAAVPVEQCFVF